MSVIRETEVSRYLIPTLIVATLGCAAQEAIVPCDPIVEGVQVVTSVAPNAWNSSTEAIWTELWRVGGLREGQEFEVPVSAAVSLTGDVAVPDFSLGEVVLIDSNGTWMGPVVRKGPGPEELQTPVAASWSADDVLWVFDVVSPKVLRYTGPGEPVTSVPVPAAFTAPVVAGGELLWAGIQPGGSVLLYPGWRPVPDEHDPQFLQAVVLRQALSSTRIDTLARVEFPAVSASGHSVVPMPGWARPVAAVGATGLTAIGGLDGQYRIMIYDSTGALMRQVCRDVPALPLSPEERGDVDHDGIDGLAAAIREAPQASAPAPFGHLVVGADGSLWVQRQRQPSFKAPGSPLYGVGGGLFDIFDSEGRFLGSARVPERAYLVGALGDTIWTFEVGSLDEIELVAYQRGH